MSDNAAQTIVLTVIVLCGFALVVLTLGDPDLLDAIIAWVRTCR